MASLLERIGIEIPIIQAPMAGTSTPAMAAAVANAGALGSIGVGAVNAAAARTMIEAVRAATDGPFNVNVFCHAPGRADAVRERAWLAALGPVFERFGAEPPAALAEIYRSFVVDEDMLEVLLETRPAVVSFHFGLPPARTIARLKDAGIVLLSTATNLAEAEAAVAAGVDAIVAQGWEAGGHRGVFDPAAPDTRLGTFALTRVLVRKIPLPVIAAGGMMDGAGIAAALDLGAVAAQLGTAFIACPESSADQHHRAALFSPGATATEMVCVISGRPARCLPNSIAALGQGALAGLEPPDYPIAYDAGKALNAAAKAKGDGGYGAQWAGQGAPLARALPAGELVGVLAEELAAARGPLAEAAMDRLDAMKVFVTALDEGSLAAAGRRLKRSPASVSRAIAFLEDHVGAPLLHRTTRVMRLSPAGERYADACRRILADLEEAELLAVGEGSAPRGVLTLSAPPIAGEEILQPIVNDFLLAHPAVSVRMLLLDRNVNLVDEGVDLAMRVGVLPDSSLIATKVGGDVRRVIVGSPDYLAKHPPIETPGDLARHDVVAMSNFGLDSWVFPPSAGSTVSRTVSFRPRLEVNSVRAAVASARRGVGVTRLYSFHVADQVRDGALQIVLSNAEPAPLPVHLLAQPSRAAVPKLRAFVDFAVPRLRAEFARLADEARAAAVTGTKKSGGRPAAQFGVGSDVRTRRSTSAASSPCDTRARAGRPSPSSPARPR